MCESSDSPGFRCTANIIQMVLHGGLGDVGEMHEFGRRCVPCPWNATTWKGASSERFAPKAGEYSNMYIHTYVTLVCANPE